MERRRLVTIEEIYENFDVPHIRRLMEYSDRRDPINMDNVIIHTPLSEELPDDGVNMIDNREDYEAKVIILERQLKEQRERMLNSQPSYVQATTDDTNETVEIPKNLLKQLMNVLNNNKNQK